MTGDTVRGLRQRQGLTQQQLAQQCGIPQSDLSAIETGRLRLGRARAEAIARVLRVHPGDLLWPQWDAEGSGR